MEQFSFPRAAKLTSVRAMLFVAVPLIHNPLAFELEPSATLNSLLSRSMFQFGLELGTSAWFVGRHFRASEPEWFAAASAADGYLHHCSANQHANRFHVSRLHFA